MNITSFQAGFVWINIRAEDILMCMRFPCPWNNVPPGIESRNTNQSSDCAGIVKKEKDGGMTTKSDYTPQEWEQLQKPLLLVGPTVAEAVDSGALGTVLEYGAILDAAITVRNQYASNVLLQSLLRDAQLHGLGRLPDRQKEQPDVNYQHLKMELLASCRGAVDVLHAKAPRQETMEYTYAVLNIGIHVANASRDGESIPGGPRQRISEAEATVLKEVSEALGISQ